MDVVKWIRAALDEWQRTPHVKALERQVAWQRTEITSLREVYDLVESRQRAEFNERLRDKQAVIEDLRWRLAVAEADKMRVEQAKVPVKREPIPDFGGPVSFQDELARMPLTLVVDDAVQETDHEV